jgi:hypothetical protein
MLRFRNNCIFGQNWEKSKINKYRVRCQKETITTKSLVAKVQIKIIVEITGK